MKPCRVLLVLGQSLDDDSFSVVERNYVIFCRRRVLRGRPKLSWFRIGQIAYFKTDVQVNMHDKRHL